MAVPYFGEHHWSELTREERFYCFILYSHVVADPSRFARFLSERPGFGFDCGGEWDIGVEVCFIATLDGTTICPCAIPNIAKAHL